MPILTLQRQLRELGRIRTGNQVAFTDQKGKTRSRPAKLETFRLTSESRELIEAAATAYGGTVVPWNNGGSAEWEVITASAVLDIVVPPGQPVSQWYELWSGGGCQRRCDGITNVLTMQPCSCPADVEQRLELAKNGEACKATTRLNVMLPALPDLGVWRLESHGFYAAVELAGAAEILAMATARGSLIPARLRLEQREKKVPGKPTNRYAVPVIEFVETRMGDLQLLASGSGSPALGAGERPARPALPATTLPASSDFRAPAAPQATEPETIDGEAADAGEELFAEASPAQTRAPLVEILRDTAAASGLKGPATQPQKDALQELLKPLGKDRVIAGVLAAFGVGLGEISAAQAQAVIGLAESEGHDAFRERWAELAA